MDHIPQLIETLQRANLAIFLGADLPQAATGRPSRADLAARLAQRLGFFGQLSPWPEVAAQYESQRGRQALIAWLRDQLESAGRQPGPIYRLLAQLPVAAYITTAYDTWLHTTLRDVGRQPNTLVAGPAEVGFVEANRPTVVHLFGVYDRPESLALTAADLRRLPQTKAQLLAGLVQPTLANKTVLILGQDLHDTYFQQLYQASLFQAGTIRPSAFAVWQGLAGWEKQTWLDQEVRVVEAPPLDLLAQLLGVLQPETAVPPPVEPAPQPPTPPAQPAVSVAAVRDLLLAAFTVEDLRRLVFYASNPALRPLSNEFGPSDGLATVADKTITYCHKRGLLPALLEEVKAANPTQYDLFAPRLGL